MPNSAVMLAEDGVFMGCCKCVLDFFELGSRPKGPAPTFRPCKLVVHETRTNNGDQQTTTNVTTNLSWSMWFIYLRITSQPTRHVSYERPHLQPIQHEHVTKLQMRIVRTEYTHAPICCSFFRKCHKPGLVLHMPYQILMKRKSNIMANDDWLLLIIADDDD